MLLGDVEHSYPTLLLEPLLPVLPLPLRVFESRGKQRIKRHIGELQETLRGLETESVALQERVEARIQELTKTKAEAVRESIEKSIIDLRQLKKELEEKGAFLDELHTANGVRLEDRRRPVHQIQPVNSASARPIRGSPRTRDPGVDLKPATDGHRNETGSLRGPSERASSCSVPLCSQRRSRTINLVVIAADYLADRGHYLPLALQWSESTGRRAASFKIAHLQFRPRSFRSHKAMRRTTRREA